jgi:predicted dehydrogenase
MTRTRNSRRIFLGHAASAATLSSLSYSRILGANDRLETGLIGCGGRGAYMLEIFRQFPEFHVAALCDVYGERVRRFQRSNPDAVAFSDHRALVELKHLDVVVVATPDHWHAETTIDSLNAGKDVYVEKPLTFRMEEGRQIIRAARHNQKICQVGMQQRSGPHYIRARDEYVQAGRLGKISLVRSWWHGGANRPIELPVKDKPDDLNWERFLGQVPWREWNPYQYFNYRGYLDFGGGKITDLFTHWVDATHMLMGEDNPVSIVAAGGVYYPLEGQTAPDTITLMLEYPGGWTLTFESAALDNMPEYGIEFCGTEGRLRINRSRFEFIANGKGIQPVVVKSQREITIDHVQNFLESCRSRKLPNGDVYYGHRGVLASHLATTSYIQRRRVQFDPGLERILL